MKYQILLIIIGLSFIFSKEEHTFKLQNVSKIKVITGKGSRSKNKENPYQSKNLSILKHSVPDYINSNQELLKVIKSLDEYEIDDLSKGSFVILLKNNRKS